MASDSQNYVFGYVDPDTDGVMSSIGYAHLRKMRDGEDFTPVVFGKIDSETRYVLDELDLERPQQVETLPDEINITIVDTHYPNQLPEQINLNDIVQIIDHHPGGSMDPFPNAEIQNEEVGAAATLVAEKIRNAEIEPDDSIAGGLAAAIISNTLNFTAPSTVSRDREAYNWLAQYSEIDEMFIQEMFKMRSDITDLSTPEVLKADYKEFQFPDKDIGIAQLETVDLNGFIRRDDFKESLEFVEKELDVDHIIFNGVDIMDRKSVVAVTEPKMKELYTEHLECEFDAGLAHLDEIILRKTHIVPPLEANYEKE